MFSNPVRPRLMSLLALALPMVLSRASQALITVADARQVKDLGAGAIAATSTGGLNVIGFVILPMGTVFIVQSFVAQLAGRGERDQAARFAWYGLAIAAIAAIVSLALIPTVGPILALTDYPSSVRNTMTDYMAIRMLSVGAIVGIEVLGNWYGGLGNTWMAMIAGVITMVSAIGLNWVLIDGHLGAPALGVNGAAIASAIASWLGFAFLALAFWRGWGGAPAHPAKLGLSRREFWRVIRFGLPNGLNWFLEFAAFQVFVNVIFSGLGETTIAALSVVLAINSISFMPAFGLASAGAILAAQAIGRGARDDVWPGVKLTLISTCTWMIAIATGYLLASHALLGWFSPASEPGQLVAVGGALLAISAAWQVFDAIGLTLAETLRAAGDTAWPAAVRIVLAWLVFLPAAYYIVHRLDGGARGAMAGMVGYLALIALALALRFRSGAWRKIELLEPKLAA